MAKKIKSIIDLSDDLVNVYNKLRDGEIGQNEAKELANIAGKVISANKAKMEYNKMTGNQSEIEFMEG